MKSFFPSIPNPLKQAGSGGTAWMCLSAQSKAWWWCALLFPQLGLCSCSAWSSRPASRSSSASGSMSCCKVPSPSVPHSSTLGRLEGQPQEVENQLNQDSKIWEYESELFYEERHWVSKHLASIHCANIDCQPPAAQLSCGFITAHLERLSCITRELNFLELVFQKYDDQTPLLALRYINIEKPEQKKGTVLLLYRLSL